MFKRGPHVSGKTVFKAICASVDVEMPNYLNAFIKQCVVVGLIIFLSNRLHHNLFVISKILTYFFIVLTDLVMLKLFLLYLI